jgi:hypothetical protein
MEDNFEQLVGSLNIFSSSTDVLHQITLFLKQQTDESLSPFVSQLFQSLSILEDWAWQLLSQNSHEWVNQSDYQELFYTLASFNKKLIYNESNIDPDKKASLLFPVTVDQIDRIFEQIENSNDDNDPFISIPSLWFDNHSYFVHDNPHCNILAITDHINQYIGHNYLMSDQFKLYLTQLLPSQLPQSIFTAKMLFYIKTCSFSLFSYIGVGLDNFPCTAEEIVRYIGKDYLHIVHVHSHTVASWSKDLLACMAHFISFIAQCCWWDGQKRTQIKILFPNEQITCDHVEDLVRILAHKPFQKEIKAVRSNDETILIDAGLIVLITIAQRENINWYFRSNSTIQNVLSVIGEISSFDKICLCAYGILGEVLTEEQLKDLKIVESISGFFFNMLKDAWYHPSKTCKRIPIEYLLRGKYVLLDGTLKCVCYS